LAEGLEWGTALIWTDDREDYGEDRQCALVLNVMSETYLTTRNGRKILLNTPEEDAAITNAALSDADARPFTEEEWAAVKPGLRRVGRPSAEVRKVSTTIRFDADVLEALKATGPGWQTRVNDAMRALFLQSPEA